MGDLVEAVALLLCSVGEDDRRKLLAVECAALGYYLSAKLVGQLTKAGAIAADKP